ncbi:MULTISPECIES: glycine betaine ABC transporter substrate-binding protein [Hyphomicrobiales]|jgi:osmoprotectant transport system substrate-binding protein|uniref:glycine betaine ABC transporter substrate-binding protein n=1 Tax=Methylobacterium sp. CCH7-A2 TaxID=1768789 RepID=UPI00082F0951|nr:MULTISPECIES: glycine betaine ABC transporter substrate-binding protein [Hyphomicrobiales]
MKQLFRAAFIAALGIVNTQVFAKELVVGGKGYTEQLLVAEMTTQLLNYNAIPARKVDGMGTSVLRKALENGEVDLYWEQTGTALITHHKIEQPKGAVEDYETVKALDAKSGIVWLALSGANNTYALAVRSKDDLGLDTLSDLAAAFNRGDKLKMGVNAEFPRRQDGLLGLQTAYSFRVPRENVVAMQGGLVYSALRDGQINVGLVFTTDGRIDAYGFKVLKDDKKFFPDYIIAPNVRKPVLDDNPKLAGILNDLSGRLDVATMKRLNGMVDVDQQPVERVARQFLIEQKLMK